jgi:hypothetical protein
VGQPDPQQRPHLRAAAARHVALLLALNFALFIPAFVFRSGAGDLFPFTPREHPHGAFGFDARSAVEYVKALLLRRPNPDVWRLSVELLLASSLLAFTARRRAARALPWLFGALYAGLLLFLFYEHAFAHVFESVPAVSEDATMAVNLFHYLGDRWGGLTAWSALFGLVLAVGLASVLAGLVFRAFARSSAEWSARGRVVLLAVTAWGIASTLWFGVERDDPVMQLVSKRVVRNVRVSLERRARLHAIAGSVPDRRYDAFLRAKLKHKPRVHLIMVEAYGQRLTADAQMNAPFRALTRVLEQRFTSRGLSMRTALSASPVFGGRSWLSIATVQTGIRLDQPSLYAELEKAPRITTLTDFFHAQGYRTLALQPGNRERTGMKHFDLFRRDVMLNGPDVEYRGTPYNQWVGIPDQYSLGYYREHALNSEPGPVFSFVMTISTHHPWNAIPFAADWRALNEAQVPDVPLVNAPVSDGIEDGLPRRYFEAVVYDWRALADFIEAEATEDAVFFIVGDHQPLLERTSSDRILSDIAAASATQTLLTPVHVISRDAAFVARFEKYGFVDGLFQPVTDGALKHEGLFSLFATELVTHHGEVTEGVQYLPDGVGLAGLSVR